MACFEDTRTVELYRQGFADVVLQYVIKQPDYFKLGTVVAYKLRLNIEILHRLIPPITQSSWLPNVQCFRHSYLASATKPYCYLARTSGGWGSPEGSVFRHTRPHSGPIYSRFGLFEV